jgi:intein-encoded DNA endonuclease-like protein
MRQRNGERPIEMNRKNGDLALGRQNKIILYNQVNSLCNKGLSTREISKITKIPKSTVWQWVSKKNHPLTNINKPNLQRSPCLSYILGVIYGDGSVGKYKRHYSIQLAAVNYDFVKEFNKCLTKIMNKKTEYKIQKKIFKNTHRLDQDVFRASSKIFYTFLRGKDFKDFLNIIKKYPDEFIRGFADSEGSVSSHSHNTNILEPCISMANKNKELLEFIKNLLYQYFGIKAHVHQHTYHNSYISYSLDISNKDGVYKFYKSINFTNSDKKKKLAKIIKQMEIKK